MTQWTNWFDAEDYASHALDMFESGRWAEAEIELRKALAIQPDQPEWLFNLGLVLESSGRDLQACVLYERAARLAPDQIDVVASAALVCARLGNTDRALHWCERVLALDPDNEEAHARRIEMLVGQGRHDEAETAFYLAEMTMDRQSPLCLHEIAVSLISREQYRRAGWCLREAMRIEPGLPRIRVRMAEVQASTGQLDRALSLCARELREDPANVDALSLQADLLERAGRLIEAADTLRRVLDFEPASVHSHESLGRVMRTMGRNEQAMVEYRLVRKLAPGHPEVDLILGEIELAMDQPRDARRSFLRAFELYRGLIEDGGPDVTQVIDRSRLAQQLLGVDLVHECVVLLESEPAIGDDVDALRLLALARYRSGDRRGGLAISRRVLRLDPTCLRSMHNLALAALQRGRFTLASRWIRRGLKVEAGDEGLRRLRLRVWFCLLGVLPRPGRSRRSAG